jgi:hypothetical protein
MAREAAIKKSAWSYARSAAAAGLGRRLGPLRLIFPGLRQSYERPAADSMNPRQAVVVKRANPSDEIGLRAGAGRP